MKTSERENATRSALGRLSRRGVIDRAARDAMTFEVEAAQATRSRSQPSLPPQAPRGPASRSMGLEVVPILLVIDASFGNPAFLSAPEFLEPDARRSHCPARTRSAFGALYAHERSR